MHLAVYRATGAGAIVHTHSPFVVALSTVLDELPAVHYAMADLGGIVRWRGESSRRFVHSSQDGGKSRL